MPDRESRRGASPMDDRRDELGDLRVAPDDDLMGLRRTAPVTFTFDGAPVRGYLGESVGAALLAAGTRSLRRTRKAGRPRGLFCAIGSCFDCLVTVDGEGPVRACVTPVEDGLEVDSHDGTR